MALDARPSPHRERSAKPGPDIHPGRSLRFTWLALAIVSSVALPALADDAKCVWKTTDIIDARIDIGAQQALFHMMSSGPPDSKIASAMIGAVKDGTLAGILLPPRQAVAKRSARMEPARGYWALLDGHSSVCLLEPDGEPPMLVYREGMERDAIVDALEDAWPQCGLSTPDPPCGYSVDAWKPDSECDSDQACVDKGLGWKCLDHRCVDCETSAECQADDRGNVCTADHRCVYSFEGGDIGPDGGSKEPDCWYDANCREGWTCTNGRCIPPDAPEHRCYERAQAEYRQEDKKCEDDEAPRLVECAAENWSDPVPLAKCLHDSYDERTECKKGAFRKFEEEKKDCYGSS